MSAHCVALAMAACVCCVALLTARQEHFSARVVTVIDGDTIVVLRDGHEVRVRLEGIDAPEAGQEFWEQAKAFMTDAVLGKTIVITGDEIDTSGRLIARVTVDGRDVSLAAVEAGCAWQYIRHSKEPALTAAETRAREDRRGLWAQSNPVPPWAYRAAQGIP